MALFAVTREAGPGWTDGKGAFEQPGVEAHAAFMATLAEGGFVQCAGPLSGSEQGRIRALVVTDAVDEAEIHRRLADDPWARSGHLVTTNVEPWILFVGAERLGRATVAVDTLSSPAIPTTSG